MTKIRKRHDHPPLVPPKHISDDGVLRFQDNDHGSIINGRMYSYHPTKGWRNNNARDMGFNLTRYLIERGRR